MRPKRWKVMAENLQEKSFDERKLTLLEQSYFFNRAIQLIRKQKDGELKAKHTQLVADTVNLHLLFIIDYLHHRKFIHSHIAERKNIYYVYDTKEGPRKTIEDLGIFIRVDPDKSEKYYLNLIRKIKSTFAYVEASDSEIENYHRRGGMFANDYDDKKSSREQTGKDRIGEIMLYLKCEAEIKLAFSTTSSYQVDGENILPHVTIALNQASLDLKMNYARIETTYYRVCRRYNIPTYKDFSFIDP